MPYTPARLAGLLVEVLDRLQSGDRDAARLLVQRIDEFISMTDTCATLPHEHKAGEDARADVDVDRNPCTRSLDASTANLTRAELRVLPYLQTHLTRAEIAERLHVSPHTLGTHISAIFRKLGASTRTQAVERALQMGMLRTAYGVERMHAGRETLTGANEVPCVALLRRVAAAVVAFTIAMAAGSIEGVAPLVSRKEAPLREEVRPHTSPRSDGARKAGS